LSFIEEKKSDRKFTFLNALRIAILSVILVVLIFIAVLVDESSFSFFPIFASVGVAIVLSIFCFKLFRWLSYRVVLYFQCILDIALITLLVFYSGGISSPFYFLYILPIIVASVFLSRRDTIYIATFSYIVFSVLSDLIYMGVFPHYPLTPIDITLNVFIYNLIMSFVAFSSIAILSSYYFDRIRKTGAALKNVRENLKDLMLLNNTVLEKMENGFIVSDSRGVIISYNEKSKGLLKLTGKSNIFDILSASVKYGVSEDQQKKYYFEIEVNELVLGISYSIVENIYSFDKVYVFIITDLSEKRRIEKKLKQKEHFALIGEMSASIAHEIRNPLASISGSVQFLSKELKLDPEYQHLMDIIVKESSRLSNSIEVFLDYTKTTPLDRIDFDLSQMIDDIAALVSINYPGIKIVKKYSDGYIINGDVKKIEQVAWNLINNASKAVREDGIIEVNIYNNHEDDICLSVKDSGIGIDESEMERIFVPFYSKFTSGIGLGMSIVKRIVDEHNFEIRINSERDIGTEVIICFKAA
jgi:two-component system sensor histidine kinase PilS (NtrC family)